MAKTNDGVGAKAEKKVVAQEMKTGKKPLMKRKTVMTSDGSMPARKK